MIWGSPLHWYGQREKGCHSMSSIYLNLYDNKEKLKLVGMQEIEINILLRAGDWRRACFRIDSSICSFFIL